MYCIVKGHKKMENNSRVEMETNNYFTENNPIPNFYFNKVRRKDVSSIKNEIFVNKSKVNRKRIDNGISERKIRRNKHFQPCSSPSYFVCLVFCFFFILPVPINCQDSSLSEGGLVEDDRCYLTTGGSVANFFINESLPVGSVIGSLKIGGDPREGGNIHLLLETKGLVQIAPHSKDLILMGRIDKEGKQGQSHITVDVKCQRLGTAAPPMIIPVNIRVTDVNDNAPVFQNSPYYVNISEATVVGTVIFSDIHATDQDQKGPFSTVWYTIGAGPHSNTFEFESPLRGSLLLKEPLDYEKYPVFNVTIIAQDRGSNPQQSQTYLTVYVSDSDDQNPTFTRQRYMATLPQPPMKGSVVEVQPSPIMAKDQDTGIQASIVYSLGSDVPEAMYFGIDSYTGEVFLNEDIPPTEISQPISLSIFATQTDNPDRRAGTILTVSRRGYKSSQLQFVKTFYNISVPENLPINSVITETIINRNIDGRIQFGLRNSGHGVFGITNSGQILLLSPLDYESQQLYNIEIIVSDGQYNDTAKLVVSVLNVNDWDPRFRFPQYEFYITSEEMVEGSFLGAVEVADGDIGDRIELTLMGQDSRFFSVNSLGEIHLVDTVGLNFSEAHVVVLARDSGDPPRQSSVPVTIKLPDSLAIYSAHFLPTSWFLLVMIFGGLLAVFILIVICLAVYIHKNKKFREDPAAALPTKLSALVPASMGGGSKVQPLALPSRNGRNGLLRPTLSNGNPKDNNCYTCSEMEEEDDTPTLSNGRRRYPKNVVIPQPCSVPSSTNSSANGDGASLNGTSSTASVGTPELSRPNGTVDGTARATGGMPSAGHRVPPAAGASGPTNYLYPHTPSYSTFSPRQRSPSPSSQFEESTFSPHVLRPPSAFSNGGVEQVNPVLYEQDNSRCSWPSGTIPKKVKKLSWEDELYAQTELDPEVSVTPMPQRQPTAPHPNKPPQDAGPGLTVYF